MNFKKRCQKQKFNEKKFNNIEIKIWLTTSCYFWFINWGKTYHDKTSASGFVEEITPRMHEAYEKIAQEKEEQRIENEVALMAQHHAKFGEGNL